MTHCAGPHALIPGGQSCIVGTKKRENTKSIQTIFFSFREPFLLWSSAGWPEQHVEPLTEFRGELRVERKPWLGWVLLFCDLQGRGLYFQMRRYQSEVEMPGELVQKISDD